MPRKYSFGLQQQKKDIKEEIKEKKSFLKFMLKHKYKLLGILASAVGVGGVIYFDVTELKSLYKEVDRTQRAIKGASSELDRLNAENENLKALNRLSNYRSTTAAIARLLASGGQLLRE